MQVHLKYGKQGFRWLEHRDRKENPSIRKPEDYQKEKVDHIINQIRSKGKLIGYKVDGQRMTVEEFEKTGLVYKFRVNKVKSKAKPYKKRKKRYKKNKTYKSKQKALHSKTLED